jgi:DNA-binding NarL/FixJ family response regulator
MKIKVLIVEDDQIVSSMYQAILTTQKDIEIVGFATTKEMAMSLAKELKPHVMLVDINLTHKEDQYGVDVAIEISLSMPDIKIVICSGILNEDTVRSTMGIGVAFNYLLKTDTEKIPFAIRDAYNDISNIEDTVLEYILKDYRESLKSTMNKLTPHHIKVLELFYRGYSVEDVGNILFLEIQSVRNLQQQIAKRCLGWKYQFRKLSAIELAQRAKSLGFF